MTNRVLMLTLNVQCEEPELMLKATETLTRVQVGLALEGLYTQLTVTAVESEEAEQEEYGQ